jgi:L-amino acid N-acyltransferase YncA
LTAARIRHADPELDAAACAAIYEPYVRGTVISFEEHPPDAAELSRRIEAISSRYPWLVAEDGGTVTGYAYASQHKDRAAYRWAADVAVYVTRGAQRRGIGRNLYETLFELLVAQGIRLVCAGITLPNQASVALHEAVGFERVGVYRRIGWKAGAWHDVGWWQRELVPPGSGPPPEPGPPVRLPG